MQKHVFGTGSGLIALRVKAKRADEPVALDVSLPALGLHNRFSATLPHKGIEYELHPPLHWDIARLRGIKRPLTVRMRFSLKRGRSGATSRSITVQLHALNEALYFVREGGDSVDLSWIFAAYVDEHAAVVRQILDDGRKPPASSIVSMAMPAARSRRLPPGVGDLASPDESSHPLFGSGSRPSNPARTCITPARPLPGRHLGRPVSQLHRRQRADRLGAASASACTASSCWYPDTPLSASTPMRTHAMPPISRRRCSAPGVAAPRSLPAFARGLTDHGKRRRSLATLAESLAAGRAGLQSRGRRFDGQHRPDYALIDIGAARAFGIVPIATGRLPRRRLTDRWPRR